ncbi:MAG: glycosyl transferase [Firmicutes bacterium HGW-Firmicutes-20]|nr:MAG: glycosyl transferase [Firmicutes bacterium HGW-Firmicutes-20]PKM70171.1 MAG: glycosyl transferase [Firmicutes bacterium HGW-Firmicutes-19]
MNKTMISIITPAYNASRYLRECIKSVLAQSDKRWEMIIVNDASTDDTLSIIEEYVQKDSRIKCISLPNNGGIANARNTGLIHAQGRYVAFLDSDDCWRVDKLQKQLDFMLKNQAAFVFSSYQIMDENSVRSKQVISAPDKVTFSDLIRANYIGCLTVMIDTEVVRSLTFPKIKHEDFACWLSVLHSGIVAFGQDEILADYRKSFSSTSGNKVRAIGWVWNIFRNHLHLSLIKALLYTIRYAFNTLHKYSKSKEVRV